MIRNYLKIAWRNLWKNKSFSVINITGLAVGMTTVVLILLYVTNEVSYDKHHKDGDRVYRMAYEVTTTNEQWVAMPAPLAAGLKNDFPEVEQVTRLLRFPGVDKALLKNDNNQKQFFEINSYYVDSTFFEIFSYDFKYGDINTALNEPNTVILSEEVATKLYGQENPVNKVLTVGLSFGEFKYTVKGVFKNNGHKSHIPAHLLMSMNNGDVGQWVKNQKNWGTNNIFHTYAKLKAGTDAKAFEKKLPSFFQRNGGADLKAMGGDDKKLFMQKMEDIYLRSNNEFEIAPNGNIGHLYIFSSIAVFLLLIACINFMNLSTARSEKRAKEVGMRKVIGAVKSNLVGQFLGESLLMSGLALVVTFILVQLLIPVFNQLTGKELSIAQYPQLYIWLTGLTIVTGIVSGLYPAFYLSAFKPITVLKGKLKNNFSAALIRKGLIVFQFTISTVLILGAVLISQQMDYLSSRQLGFSKNQKIILPIQTDEANSNLQVLKNELVKDPRVIQTGRGSVYPGIENIQDMLFYAEGKSLEETVDINTVNVDNDYVKTLGIQLLNGRSFSKEFTADTNALVLNETAINKLGYTVDNAVGKKIYFDFKGTQFSLDIIGVIKDYHYQSLHQEIKPLALSIHPFFGSPASYLIIDVNSSDYAGLLAGIQKTWNSINTNSPFEYSFLDQDFQKNYEKDRQTSQLIRYFTLLGIIIACLGLFGLAAFSSEQRFKEIGVRKVLGASVTQIITLLSKDFLKLVCIAILIATPIAWYCMHQWLQGFAYSIRIEWWVFLLAGVTAILVALLTVSFQVIRAALGNPVKSLRTE